MEIYDLAHKLAKALKESEEYQEFDQLRQKVQSDSSTVKMIKDYQMLQLQVQTAQYMGQEVDEKDQERLKKLEELINLNATVQKYLQAENRMGLLLQDIQRIMTSSLDLALKEEKEE